MVRCLLVVDSAYSTYSTALVILHQHHTDEVCRKTFLWRKSFVLVLWSSAIFQLQFLSPHRIFKLLEVIVIILYVAYLLVLAPWQQCAVQLLTFTPVAPSWFVSSVQGPVFYIKYSSEILRSIYSQCMQNSEENDFNMINRLYTVLYHSLLLLPVYMMMYVTENWVAWWRQYMCHQDPQLATPTCIPVLRLAVHCAAATHPIVAQASSYLLCRWRLVA